MKLSWIDDLVAEAKLRRMGVVFEVAALPFAKIDLKESQVNGARIGDPIVKELVADYMQAMRNGDSLPRPIVHPGKAGWIVLSGVQRTTSVHELIKAGELPANTHISCYKLDECDNLLRQIIARTANNWHGGRQSLDDRIKQAVYCVRALGMQINDAAKDFVIGPTTLSLHIRAEKERDALLRAGIDATELPATTLDAISKLPFDTNAKHQVAVLTVQHNVSADRVKQVVSQMKKAKTQQARTQQVKAFERDLAEQAKATAKPVGSTATTKVPSRPRRDKVLRLCDSLVQFLEHGNDGDSFTSLEQLQFVGDTDTARLKTLVGRLSLRWNVLEV